MSSILVAQSVCNAFKKKPKPPGFQIEHWDQNKRNNRLDNLKYVSQSANIRRHYKIVGRKKRVRSVQYTQAGHDLICAIWKTGRYSQVQIAKACGMHNSSICLIVNGKQGVSPWAHTDVDVDWQVLGLSGPEDLAA